VVAWGEAILKHSGVFVDPKPFIAEDFDDLLAVLMAKRVDAVVLRTTEFLSMPPSVLDNDFIYSNRRAHGECEQYVVIARDDPRHRDVSDQRGKRLIVWANDRASLALPWLETFLAERRLPPVAEFFGTRSSAEKISTTVLPVFFGQSDVCLVTRSGFEDMVELNPQVGKTLQILDTSPDVVPSFFCFRAGFDSPYRDNIEKAILSLHESTDGAQVLTTFQCEQIVRRPVSTLETSRRIYQAWCDLQRGRPSSQGPSTPGSAHGRTR
jgi:phosphonate transport system substrate-binding protein